MADGRTLTSLRAHPWPPPFRTWRRKRTWLREWLRRTLRDLSRGTQIVCLLALVNAAIIVLVMFTVVTWPWSPAIFAAIVIVNTLPRWLERRGGSW